MVDRHGKRCLIIFIGTAILALLWFRHAWKCLGFHLTDFSERNGADSGFLKTSTAKTRALGQNLTPKVHIIIQFPMLNFTSELAKVRNEEYLDTLQRNLAHPQVLRIHLLQESAVKRTEKFLKMRKTQNMEKLMYFHLGRRMLYSDAFRYASDKLLNKNVVIMNSDCYLEEGFEQLDPFLLRRGVVYALSRHDQGKSGHCPNVRPNMCLNYNGSHDAFVFHLHRKLTNVFLTCVHFYPNVLGAENVLIYCLRRHAEFKVKNPCNIMRVVHNHCSGLRPKRLTRLNRMMGVRESARPSPL